MAGRIIRILERSNYDYSDLTATKSVKIKIADLDVSGAREVTLLVRVHAADITGSLSNFTVEALASAPTNEDPNQDFYDKATPVASVVVPDAAILLPANIPTLLLGAVSANCGAWITIFLTANQVAAGALSATLSIDASLKE